tara:strand:+ start:1428 stop:2111 length:684 start_codon:yes stop_codon:yes gene_type:complete
MTCKYTQFKKKYLLEATTLFRKAVDHDDIAYIPIDEESLDRRQEEVYFWYIVKSPMVSQDIFDEMSSAGGYDSIAYHQGDGQTWIGFCWSGISVENVDDFKKLVDKVFNPPPPVVPVALTAGNIAKIAIDNDILVLNAYSKERIAPSYSDDKWRGFLEFMADDHGDFCLYEDIDAFEAFLLEKEEEEEDDSPRFYAIELYDDSDDEEPWFQLPQQAAISTNKSKIKK